jgi:hypothetical protein
MVKGFATKTSVGVGDFTNGFDPSNSCIANLASNWGQCTELMNTWGFDLGRVSLAGTLQESRKPHVS